MLGRGVVLASPVGVGAERRTGTVHAAVSARSPDGEPHLASTSYPRVPDDGALEHDGDPTRRRSGAAGHEEDPCGSTTAKNSRTSTPASWRWPTRWARP